MKTQNHVKEWGLHSVSYWVTLFLALGIIFVGVRFIVAPSVGADGFGIGIIDAHDLAYGRIKGIRDIFSGLMLLPLLWMRMRTATAWVFTTTIIVPVTDGVIVLVNNGADVPHLLIHWGTAAVMMVTSFLLFRNNA